MKKIISVLLAIALAACCLAGCGGSTQEAEPTTVGTKIQKVFDDSEKTEVAEVVDELIEISNELTEANMLTMDVVPGWLSGFSADITEFSEGLMFSPMIGAIPFVGYVFKSEDPEALKASLEENHDLAWNICTQADEMVTSIRGDLVFFVMCFNEE